MTDADHEAIHSATTLEILEIRAHITPSDYRKVDGRKIHHMVGLPDAYYDDTHERLLFRGESQARQRKFLYYVGAENEAQLFWHDGEYTIWECVSEGRVARHYADSQETLHAGD